MSQHIEDLGRLLTDYLIGENREAVISDDAVRIAARTLDVTSKALFNGPAGVTRRGLELTAAFFLLRSSEIHCVHDHSVAVDFLIYGGGLGGPLLDEARECLLQHARTRVAYGDAQDLTGSECDFEIDLLEHVCGVLLDSGGPGAPGAVPAYWLAQLRWRRFLLFLLRADGEAEAELERCLDGFTAVSVPGRTVLPPLVREYVQCLDPGTVPAGGLVDERFRSGSAAGVRRPEAGRGVLMARIERERFPGNAADIELATALRIRAMATGRLADQREIAELAERVWRDTAQASAGERAAAAELLIGAWSVIGATAGDDAQLEAALKVGLQLLGEGVNADSWQTWTLIVHLAQVLVEQATRNQSVQPLNQAVELVTQVTLAAKDRHERGGYREDERGDLYNESLFFAALLYKQGYDLTGSPSALSYAARCATAALEAGGQYGRQGQRYGLMTAQILFARYQEDGPPEDLDNAVTVIRGLLWSRDPGKDKPTVEERRFLAELLYIRSGRDHHQADMRECEKLFVELAREVGNDPDYPRRASLLGAASTAAAASAANPGDVREAISWARQAVNLARPGSSDEAFARLAAGQALLALHALEDSSRALEEAIGHLQAAVRLPAGDDTRSGAAFQLARALLLRDKHLEPEVVDALAEAGGERGARRHDIAAMRAAALLEVARRQPESTAPERAAAVTLLRQVALAEDADTSLRVRAAKGWGHEAMILGDPADAATAFRSAIEAQPRQLWWALRPDEQRRQIDSLRGIASVAASCAARAGMLEHSLESLERGRAVTWHQVIQMRHAARLVARADSALGERFRNALTAQQDMARYVDPQSFTEYMSQIMAFFRQQLGPSSPHPSDLKLRLAQDWKAMVAEARAIPGLEDVMRPPSASQLRKAVPDGTAVVVNMDASGSHALLVTRDGIDNVPLPGLEPESAASRLADFTIAVHALSAPDADYGPELRRSIARTMDETRRWLWDVIAEPVLKRIGLVRPPQPGEPWPRIWWCPTGLLSRLPLHAAGTDGRPGSCVIDLAVSSYTMSLTALQQSLSPPDPAARSILVVSTDELPGAPVLPGVKREIADLKAKFPGQVSILEGSQAQQGALVQGIESHEWLHLACHALPGMADQPPYLFLNDGPLRIERLGWTVSENAQLAYLSGCSTAEAALTQTDEAHHLVAAFQAAGFPNAIGTIWPADDETGTVVASRFYSRVRHIEELPGRVVAEALHHTLRSIREDGLPSFYWAPYVHYGS